MFGLVADLIASVTTILLPSYLSYKSLRSGDPAQTTPWLIYFIMLALSLLFESWTVFILGWIPFYSWIRLVFLLYLVLPQTQGAKYLYLEYVEPYIVSHETRIDRFIGETHQKLESVGLGYLSIVVDYIREKILGQASPQPSAQSRAGAGSGAAGYGAQAVSSYASDLLSRFSMPAARAPAATYNSPAPGTSLSSFLTSALSGAASSGTGTRSVPAAEQHGSFAGSAIPDLNALQGYLSSPATTSSQKSDLIQTQRDRLTILLKALDKEQQTLDLAYGSSAQTAHRPSSSGSGLGVGLGQKSRSEQSFENVSYEDIGSIHTPTSSTSQSTPQRSDDRFHGRGEAKRTTSGGWTSGWFSGSPGNEGERGRGDDDRDDLVSKGWSAARDMTEAVMNSETHRRR